MATKNLIRAVLFFFIAASVVWLIAREVSPRRADTSAAAPSADRQVMVYYFHRTARCPTCLKIEAMAKQEVEATFAAELKNGDLKFVSINVEEAGNEHFIDDYGLVSQALVLVDYRGGIQKRWKNLEAIWDLVGYESDFAQYVRNEIQMFRGAA